MLSEKGPVERGAVEYHGCFWGGGFGIGTLCDAEKALMVTRSRGFFCQ